MITDYSCYAYRDRVHAFLMCRFAYGTSMDERVPEHSLVIDIDSALGGLQNVEAFADKEINVAVPKFGQLDSIKADNWLMDYAKNVEEFLVGKKAPTRPKPSKPYKQDLYTFESV